MIDGGAAAHCCAALLLLPLGSTLLVPSLLFERGG